MRRQPDYCMLKNRKMTFWNAPHNVLLPRTKKNSSVNWHRVQPRHKKSVDEFGIVWKFCTETRPTPTCLSWEWALACQQRWRTALHRFSGRICFSLILTLYQTASDWRASGGYSQAQGPYTRSFDVTVGTTQCIL
jgi:hypothetical protein